MLEPVEQFDEKKLRGGYYTPQEITEFVCRWAIDDPGKRVLEPSCGDGNFFEASIQRFKAPGVQEGQGCSILSNVVEVRFPKWTPPGQLWATCFRGGHFGRWPPWRIEQP